MPTVGLRNTDAQQIGSTDHLDVEDRNWSAEWYDTAIGTPAFIAAITVPLAATRHNSAPEIYSMSSDILTILEAGLYLLTYTVTAFPDPVGSYGFYSYVEEDPATGTFASVPASYTSGASAFGSVTSASSSLFIHVGANYRYRLLAASFGNNFKLAPYSSPFGLYYGSKLGVMRLFKNG